MVIPEAPATRATMRKQAFDFVFLEVMELDPDDPLLKGLNKASVPPSIPAVITLTDTQIASIQVPQDDGTTTRLPIYSLSLIRVLQAWNFHLLVEHNLRRIDWLDTTMINSDAFDEYRVGTYDPNAPIKPSSGLTNVSNPTTSSASPTSSKYARTPADDFRRGVKRDKGHYNELKDEKQWDEWKRATISTIYAHGIKNIISPAYIPITPDDIALFDEQNKFMYDVFNTVLKTPMGKHFVRNHENARDAQAVWKDYLHYMRTSTKADMQIEDLMTVLTSFRLTSTYRGTSQKFIVDWLDKIRQYEDLTPKSAHFPDVMRKAMLQNALNDVKAFVDVKVSEQMDIAKGRGPIPYDQYVTLIQNVAGTYDKANSANAANRPLCPGDIRTVLSSSGVKKKTSLRQANNHETIKYCVSNHRGSTTDKRGALVDRGANGGLVGNDVRITCTTDREVDVSGIDNHQMTNLRIVTAGGVVSTQRGEVLLVMHQYAHVPQGKTIHSAIQLESFGHKVDDRSLKLKQGSQTITTLDGYVIPMNFINGLPYMPIRPYTDTEWTTLPHAILTSDVDWDPSIIDHVITDDNLKVIHRSRIKLAELDPNLRLDEPTGTETPPDPDIQPTEHHPGGNHVVDDITPDEDIIRGRPGEHTSMAIIDANDIIGRSYLQEPEEDGTRHRLKIIAKLDEHDANIANDPTMIRFRATNDQETYEEIVTYRQILDKLDHEDGVEDEWHFKSINDHQGPLQQSDADYKGSRWNVQICWENGETTWEPLGIIGKSDPVTCAIYGKEHDLLEQDGWKCFARLARRQKKLLRLAHQAKLQSFRCRPTFKFGIQIPRSHAQALELDKENGNHLWRDAEERELNQIDEYEAFMDVGIGTSAVPRGYKKIRVHMVYDMKVTLQRKARLVADGQLTDTPVDSVYSSVVSLRGLKTVLFIAELNQLEAWCTDVGNAYLEAYTDEKVYIVAGNEFGIREGRTLIIVKALYGLRSSGLRWWERFSAILADLGFVPSKAEDDIWMRDKGDHYEYIARYVDDLTIVSRDPKAIIDGLMEVYKLKLKGTGPIEYHLGCNFTRDLDGVLCMSPTKYIERMIDTYYRMFGEKPKTIYTSPLEKGDHPELDTSDELDMDGIKKYQSLIGALQWVITLGRFDIATAVMTLSSFRANPRTGHLDRAKRIYGYLSKMKHGAIRFRVGEPDYSGIHIQEYDWETTVYGEVEEIIPYDCPIAKGHPVVITTYVDANLCHDMLTGRAVTGVLHLANQTILDYYTKKQPTVESATYGSEFMAGRTATEQIMDLRTTMRYLGVHVKGATYMFGDNQTVVNSCSMPKARLHKRHVIISFHRIREAVAAKVLHFIHMPGANNPADVLSKLWGYGSVRTCLKAMLFWQGDTGAIE